MSSVKPSSTNPDTRFSLLSIVPSILINGVVTYIVYLVLKHYNFSDVAALSISALPPAVFSIIGIVRQRSLDLIAAIALAGIAVGLIAVLLGGDPRLLLIRESFFTCALGIACIISLLFPRPLMFYFGRYFAAGHDPAKVAWWNGLWQYPYFRFTQRLITGVWGVAYVGEFILRVILVYTLSIPLFLAVSPFIFGGIIVATVAWTIAYARHSARRGEEMRRQAAERRMDQAIEGRD